MNDLSQMTNIDWLTGLPTEISASLHQVAESESYPRGSRIFGPSRFPGNVYILESGLVRIYRESHEAEEVTFGYIGPGEVFGESALFDSSPRESHAIAVESSVALRVPREVLANAIRLSPSMGFVVAKQIQGRFKNIETRVEDLVFRNAKGRLAHIILQLARQIGQVEGDKTFLSTQISQKDFATLIGTTRPTVNIAMKELEANGLVCRKGGRIGIDDLDGLERSAKNM